MLSKWLHGKCHKKLERNTQNFVDSEMKLHKEIMDLEKQLESTLSLVEESKAVYNYKVGELEKEIRIKTLRIKSLEDEVAQYKENIKSLRITQPRSYKHKETKSSSPFRIELQQNQTEQPRKNNDNKK
jgi:hypothetical protein